MNFNEVSFEFAAGTVSQLPESTLPEIVFSGHSNVGKSSLINKLVQRKALARVSAQPGKTATINFYRLKEFRLVDLPGYGYAKRGKSQQDQLTRIINDYILERPQLTSLFVLIDSRHEPQKIDLEFIEWLGENAVPFGIIFTKADKLGRGRLTENVKKFLDTLAEQWEELPPHFITSSLDKSGRDEVLDYISDINKSL